MHEQPVAGHNTSMRRITDTGFLLFSPGGDVDDSYRTGEQVTALYKAYLHKEKPMFDIIEEAMRCAYRTFGDFHDWAAAQATVMGLPSSAPRFIYDTFQYITGAAKYRSVDPMSMWPVFIAEQRDGATATVKAKAPLKDMKRFSGLCYSDWISREGGLGDLIATMMVVYGQEMYHPDILYGNLPT